MEVTFCLFLHLDPAFLQCVCVCMCARTCLSVYGRNSDRRQKAGRQEKSKNNMYKKERNQRSKRKIKRREDITGKGGMGRRIRKQM